MEMGIFSPSHQEGETGPVAGGEARVEGGGWRRDAILGGRVMAAGAQGMGRKAMAGGAPGLEVRRWEACQSRTRPRMLMVDLVAGAARWPEPDAGAARRQDQGAGGTEARSR